MENLLYTWVQILHNFGAVAVVGSPAVGWWLERKNIATYRLALVALLIKVSSTAIGFTITVVLWRKGSRWRNQGRMLAWQMMLGFSTAALMAAAFLRWYL
jgi:hypothetical protein